MENIELLRSILQKTAKVRRSAKSQSNLKYYGFEELVLDCGQPMTVRNITESDGIEKGIPKHCYFNCQSLAFARSDITYVEGFVLIDAGIPIPHAWILNKENKAVEITMETSGLAYFGVPFLTKWLQEFIANRKQLSQDDSISIFEGNYIEKFSLLKEGLPNNAFYQKII